MSVTKYTEGPTQLVFFRHLRSEYTAGRDSLHADSLYNEFRSRYREEFYNSSASTRLRYLAELLHASHPRTLPDPYPLLANPDDAKKLGASLRDRVRRREMLGPDVVIVAPAMRTWLTFAGVRSEFPELMEAIKRQQVLIDIGMQNQSNLKRTVAVSGLMAEDWRVAGKDYGEISGYPEENVYFALHWDEQKKLAQLGPMAEFWYRPPQGENIPDVMQRMEGWREYVSSKYPGKVIWIFGQLDTILTFTVLAQNLPEEETAQTFVKLRNNSKPVHGGMTCFGSKYDPAHGYSYELQRYNEDILALPGASPNS